MTLKQVLSEKETQGTLPPLREFLILRCRYILRNLLNIPYKALNVKTPTRPFPYAQSFTPTLPYTRAPIWGGGGLTP